MVTIVFDCAAIIADGVKASGKKSRNGHAAEDPVKVEVARLRSELTRNELATVLTKPVKETVAVGKSLLGLGQRFGTWIGSLIKGQST